MYLNSFNLQSLVSQFFSEPVLSPDNSVLKETDVNKQIQQQSQSKQKPYHVNKLTFSTLQKETASLGLKQYGLCILAVSIYLKFLH